MGSRWLSWNTSWSTVVGGRTFARLRAENVVHEGRDFGIAIEVATVDLRDQVSGEALEDAGVADVSNPNVAGSAADFTHAGVVSSNCHGSRVGHGQGFGEDVRRRTVELVRRVVA